jgi:hypothetical protein
MLTRRQKPLWFALGASSSACVYFVASFLIPPRSVIYEPSIHYLILEEPPSKPTGSEDFDPAFIADRTGKIMRDCGARYFETTALFNDHSPTAELPIVGRNSKAIECVMLRAKDAGIKMRVETRWADPSDPPGAP